MHGFTNHFGPVARFLRPNLAKTIAALALLACAVPPAGAASALTLQNGVSKMDVPGNCTGMESESKGGISRLRCGTRQGDGTVVFYTLDESIALTPSGDRKADIAAGLEIALREGFRNFIEDSVKSVSGHEVREARLSGSQLPVGLTACKKYTMTQSGDGGSVLEIGIFCAAWNQEANAIVTTIGSVAELCLEDKCAGHSADFERRANRSLKTFRGL
jgi:hypothetical protein